MATVRVTEVREYAVPNDMVDDLKRAIDSGDTVFRDELLGDVEQHTGAQVIETLSVEFVKEEE